MERTVRHRINVGTSTKGVYTFDATIEITGTAERINQIDTDYERELILALSDKLTAELSKRYPIEKEGK